MVTNSIGSHAKIYRNICIHIFNIFELQLLDNYLIEYYLKIASLINDNIN